MSRYQNWLSKEKTAGFILDHIDRDVASGLISNANKKVLGEADTRPILEAYGMDLIPGGLANTDKDAVVIAEEIGFPVAVKVVSDQVLHKSDLGGIALNLLTKESLQNTIKEIHDRIGNAAPDARIDGYLVEKMAPKGLEVIVGMRRDPTFGPVMMFGLGGIYVELFKDVGFGVAPLSPEQAKDMITSTKAGTLLKGFRGGPVYDIDSVVAAIGRLSQLALDFPEISEVEVNPLLVLPEGQGAKVLDARMLFN